MYLDDNDMRTPRDRVNEKYLRDLLRETERESRTPNGDRRGCCERARFGGDEVVPVSAQNSCPMNNDCSPAMVYAPPQHWRNLYDKDNGWRRGTIFKELDLPFFGDRMDDGKGGCGCD